MKLVHFDVHLQVVTPLHIGTGQEWYPDADFVVEGPDRARLVRIIDVDAALLDMSASEIGSIREGRVAAALGERLRQRHTRALLPVRGQGKVTRTRALQRLPDGRPYIPGSTVKGSIRTALLQALAGDTALQNLPNPHSKDEKSAARHIEEATFGVELPGRSGVQFPNRDINRLIRATDFLPEGEIRVAFVNMSAHRVESRSAGKGASIPIWCEAIEAGSRFRGTITVEAASELWNAMNSTGQAKMNDLFGTWKEAGRRLLEAERETWASARGPIPDSVRQFFDDALGDGGHYAVLGWGGGWRSKTLGTLISTASLAKIARQYNLRRWQGRDFPDRFPVTRKLAYSTDGLRPPGWVQVSVQKEAT